MIRARIITGALLGAVLAVAVLVLPTPAMAFVLGVLWTIGAWEWAGLARLAGGLKLAYAAFCAACMLAALFVVGKDAEVVVLAVALVWWGLAFMAVLSYPRKFSSPAVAAAGLATLLPSWLLLARLHGSGPLGHELTMTVLVIVWAADVGAYCLGRWIGRVKLAPAVSPKKTWEGVSGGVLAAAAAAWAAAAVLELPVAALVAIGVATALVSVVGDLSVSVFKRNVGVKDTGSLLPGHGGVMDRIDSLTAAVPVFVFGVMIADLVR